MAVIDPRELGRLRWRCRRGTREIDELLRGYLDAEFESAPAAEQAAFRRLLEAPDPTILAYCLGGVRPAAADLAALVDRILAGAAARVAQSAAGAGTD
ncbi:MAG: succinate dehydrogenase assembly factor 2 [Gammaproteobacteria bacterium]|nr:succinate dehydrogenase assembly factor 2 [Gammaproteobacteria bacterium]